MLADGQVLRMTKQMKIEENRLAVKAQLWGKDGMGSRGVV